MPSKRKFYRIVYQVEILSDEPIQEELDLDAIHHLIINGPCSGEVSCGALEEVDGATMAKLLINQRSDPEFLGLTEDGEDTEEYEDIYKDIEE